MKIPNHFIAFLNSLMEHLKFPYKSVSSYPVTLNTFNTCGKLLIINPDIQFMQNSDNMVL